MFAGNTADPAAFTHAVATVRTKFGLDQLVMVGERGMITAARIDALKQDTDEQPPQRTNPVAAATRSAAASRRASRRKDEHDQPVRSFRALLEHLGALTRNNVRLAGTDTIPMLADPS